MAKAKDVKVKSKEKKEEVVPVAAVRAVKPEKKVDAIALPELKEMLEAGVHFGHSVKRRNPRMDEYVYAVKNGVQIFDLVKTREQLAKACEYLTAKVGAGAQIMLVGTKGQAAPTIREEAEKLKIPFITTRWVGGMFTNWEQIKGRIARLLEMRQKYEEGAYKKYTKKEQVILKREIERLERMYGGLVLLQKLPDVVFIVDPTRETTAMREAVAREIPVVAICDTNCDPTQVAQVIPANDDALKSVVMLVKAVTAAIEAGLRQAQSQKN